MRQIWCGMHLIDEEMQSVSRCVINEIRFISNNMKLVNLWPSYMKCMLVNLIDLNAYQWQIHSLMLVNVKFFCSQRKWSNVYVHLWTKTKLMMIWFESQTRTPSHFMQCLLFDDCVLSLAESALIIWCTCLSYNNYNYTTSIKPVCNCSRW